MGPDGRRSRRARATTPRGRPAHKTARTLFKDMPFDRSRRAESIPALGLSDHRWKFLADFYRDMNKSGQLAYKYEHDPHFFQLRSGSLRKRSLPPSL